MLVEHSNKIYVANNLSYGNQLFSIINQRVRVFLIVNQGVRLMLSPDESSVTQLKAS